jgi:hypothetical protein
MIITLSQPKARWAVEVAVARQQQAQTQGRPDRYGSCGGVDDHILGALGECAAAQALGVPWTPGVGTYKALGGDGVADLEVKTRSRHWYDLIYRPGDHPKRRYLLVTSEDRVEFWIHGWLTGAECMRDEWKKDHGNRGHPAWFVPKEVLHDVKFLADKPLKLAVCPRCRAYVLAGQVSGLRTGVDPAPASMEALRAALLAGKRAFRLLERAGRPHALQDLRGDLLDAGVKIMTEHGCSVRSARPVVFEEVPENPPQAPVTPGGSVGGLLRPLAPVEVSQGQEDPSRAKPASRHRSEGRQYLDRRCEACGEQMGYEEPFGVMYRDMWVHVWHDPCPRPSKEGVKDAES